MRGHVTAFIALTLAACASAGAGSSGAPARPTTSAYSPPKPPPTEVERWAALTRDLSLTLERDGKTCSQVARTLKGWLAKNAGELGSAQKHLVAWEKKADSRALDQFYRGIFPAMNTRIDAGIRCKNDAPARAAFDQFFTAAGLDMR